MKRINKIKNLLFCFACVTTCVVFVTAAYITVFWKNASLGVELLWQILFVSFLCSLSTLIYPPRESSTKMTVFFFVLHYVMINAIVMGCGLWFEWFYPDNLPMVLGMLFIIALNFALVSAIMWRRDKRAAARMNERLRKYQKEED